jgi:preprotein translocase subunit SecG
MLYGLVAALFVINCLVLMLVILLQQGKGGDIASAFGGGSSKAAFGARSGATVLSRATTVCAALFVIGAIALGILGQRGPGSVLGGRSQRGPASTPAAPAPAAPAPAAPAPAK